MPTDKDTIQAYNDYAERWRKRAQEKRSVAHEFLEKPAMFSLLPNVEDKDVLCVGCGSGEECQFIKELGAARVMGIDISKGLIEQARYAFPEVEFETMDMEKINFPKDSFDFVYSSLSIHYAENWEATLKAVYRVLKPGGHFVFSTHHPVKWGMEVNKNKQNITYKLGYDKIEDKDPVVYGDYLTPRKIDVNILGNLKVSFFHKPIGDAIKEIVNSGFVIKNVEEPKPVKGAVKQREDFYKIHHKIPLFMIYDIEKPLSQG